MLKFLKNNIYKISLIAFILLYLFMIILYYKNDFTKIDNFIYNLLYFNKNSTTFFKIITNFGSWYALFIITIISIIILKRKKYSLQISLNLLVSFVINYLFKIIFKRSRPIGINLINESGFSFPSGHTTVSAAFYGFLIYLIYKSNLNKNLKIIFITLLIILILLIGISRIYLGIHFSTDVIASYILAVIYLLVFTKLVK